MAGDSTALATRTRIPFADYRRSKGPKVNTFLNQQDDRLCQIYAFARAGTFEFMVITSPQAILQSTSCIMRDVGVFAEQGITGHYKAWEEVLRIREPAFHTLSKSLINRQMNEGPGLWPPAQVITGLGRADIMAAAGLEQPWRLAAEIITEGLVGKVAEILQMPPSRVDPKRPMYRYGVDSLAGPEVRNWISKEMQSNVAFLEVLAAVPMHVFAATIADKSKILASGGA